MANPLDEEIARQKKEQLQAALTQKAIDSGIVIARDDATNERNARMDAEAEAAQTEAHYGGRRNGYLSSSDRFRMQFAADREDKAFDRNLAGAAAGFREHQAAIENDLNERQHALHQAESYLNMAGQRHELDNKIQGTIEAADFLQKASRIPIDAEDHDAQFAQLAAELPHAGNNPLVQNLLSTRNTLRQNRWQAKQVYDEEQRKLGYGQDAQILAAHEQGLIEPGETDYKPGGVNYLHHDDGTLNKASVLAVAADRAARGQGTKASRAAYTETLNAFKVLSAKTDRDANEQEIYNSLGADLAEMIKSRKAGTQARGAAAPTGSPAPGKATSLAGGL